MEEAFFCENLTLLFSASQPKMDTPKRFMEWKRHAKGEQMLEIGLTKESGSFGSQEAQGDWTDEIRRIANQPDILPPEIRLSQESLSV